jgi:hypothetical protein
LLQVLKLHGSEHSQQIYFTDDVDYDAEQIDVDKDLDHVSENISFRLSPEASRLEPEGNVTFSTPLPDRAYGKGSASSIDSNVQFETELRQHLHDLLQYIDDLERQVCFLVTQHIVARYADEQICAGHIKQRVYRHTFKALRRLHFKVSIVSRQ